MNPYLAIILIIGTIIVIAIIICLIVKKIKDISPLTDPESIKERILYLANNAYQMSPQAFMEVRRSSDCLHPYFASTRNFAGIYIIYNQTKNMYYIGQGKEVSNRVNSHFTGKGNGDIYADYKYGNNFTIRTIPLKKSGFRTLNDLERNAIKTFHSYEWGYNKNRGNRKKRRQFL